MIRLDSHQHFWKYNPAHQVWMTDEMAVLRRDYLPDELKPLLQAMQFNGTIAVQARQMVEETEWLLELSDQHALIQASWAGWTCALPTCGHNWRNTPGTQSSSASATSFTMNRMTASCCGQSFVEASRNCGSSI